VHEHELGPLLDRVLDQLQLRGHARGDALDRARTGHLEAVRPHVLEARRVQQFVEVADQVVELGHLPHFLCLESCDFGQMNAIVRRGCGIGQSE
jgi:hypothetical protein